jgi:transposase, IS5 family
MEQQTFADVLFEQYRKPTGHERFFDERNRVVPWAAVTAALESFYPKPEGACHPPAGVERMLRMHSL